MEKQLIELVEQNDFLYDRRNKLHKDINERNRKWKEIAIKLRLPVEKVKKRWVTLRDRYYRERKGRIEADESGTPSLKKEWKYYQLMGFLDGTLTTNSRTTRSYKQEDDRSSMDIEPECVQEQNFTTPKEMSPGSFFSKPHSNEKVPPQRSRKSRLVNLSEELAKTQDEMFEVLHLAKSPFQASSSTQLFFASIAASIDEAKLPPNVVSSIKLRVQSIVDNEILHSTCTDPFAD